MGGGRPTKEDWVTDLWVKVYVSALSGGACPAHPPPLSILVGNAAAIAEEACNVALARLEEEDSNGGA